MTQPPDLAAFRVACSNVDATFKARQAAEERHEKAEQRLRDLRATVDRTACPHPKELLEHGDVCRVCGQAVRDGYYW